MWQILYCKRRTKKFINLTAFLNSNPKGSEKLGVQLASFNIDLSIPQDDNGYLDIKMGDIIVITKDESYKEVIRAGIVEEPSSGIIGWDEELEEWRKFYSLQVKQKDFSINKFSSEYENILLSDFIGNVLVHSSNELGFLKSNGLIIPKFKIICTDRIIPYVNITNKKALDQISTICKENSLFLRLDSYSEFDPLNLIKLYYQLVILDESGETPLSIQSPAITDELIQIGVYPNPNYNSDPEHEPENLFGYTLPITKNSNANEYKNYITVKAKVIANNGYLKRWTTTAFDGVREYYLPSYANKIVYVSNNLLKFAKVKFSYELRNKIRLHSHDAVHVKATDIVRFVSKDRITESIRRVVSINVYANDTMILDEDIDFDIENNETFEVISNVPIYEEGHPSLNFERTGVKITCNTDEKAKIEFLEFSEPQNGNEICVYYQEIKDVPIISSNPVSIQDIGVKDLDFEINKPLTQGQVNEIRKSVENILESESLSITAWLHTLPKAGWNIPINLKNFMNKNLKIISYNWTYYSTIVDTEKDVIMQNIELSEKIFSIEEYLKRFNKKEAKNTNLSIEKFTKNIKTFSDKVSILDLDPLISKNFKPPTLTTFEFINPMLLQVNWESYPEAVAFYVELSLNDSFTNIRSSGYAGDGSATSIQFNDFYIEENNTFYIRLKVETLVNFSDWSTVLEINKSNLVEKIIYSEIAVNGNYRLVKANNDNTNKVYLTSDSYSSLHARISHDGKKLVFTREYSASKADLMLYDLETNIITNLTNYATDNNYAWGAKFNNDDTKLLYAYQPGARASSTPLVKEMTISTQVSSTLFTDSGINSNIAPEYSLDNTKIYLTNTSFGLLLLNTVTNGTTGIAGGNNYFASQHPTQNKIVYSSVSGGGTNYEVIERNLDTNSVTQIYPAYNYNIFARYSPDGNSVIWASYETSTWQIKKKNLITNAIVNLTSGSVHNLYPEWANILEAQ